MAIVANKADDAGTVDKSFCVPNRRGEDNPLEDGLDPEFAGELYYDEINLILWKAMGMDPADWVVVSGQYIVTE